ncbi:MAG: DNA/RNA nuclease SfsA [Nitrospinaceae bacterium]|nr:DNA/RNA nuclease SfsA [Nitrospinaceae bacterium]NIR55439.1 DNA/RNA nuclease SfsA [Nitrospinaceae bacterium]NIS85879.1 DNA/RNA nuclease SfsA [Nitrospinaceae bacterium]NIT82723.1 DNA/RNA nuclease SfsA [Nitrospinaceae bacterium]NIU44932.1 DNA/RNA nuclease SfsA [Nitrospinaceae bacterium]
MKLGERIVDGVFLERPNRYLARVKIEGRTVSAHVPDPGRLPGLMIPQRRVRLIHNPGAKRKTDYTLALVRHGRIWVSVYPVFANRLVGEALENRNLAGVAGYASFASEVQAGHSRFDFQLTFGKTLLWMEVKSVSLVERSVGKFPDAPTERGRRHVEELTRLRRKGERAAVVFVSQRSDTRSITSNDAIDPGFGERLREARKAGVELYGFNCRVAASSVSLNRPIPVEL